MISSVGGGGGGGGGAAGAPPKSESSSRFGEPVPGFETWFNVALLISACVTVAGEAPGLVCRYRAIAQVTWGVAIEVPLIVFVAVSLVFTPR